MTTQRCGTCRNIARLRQPVQGLPDHFGTERTGVCVQSYDGARVLLISDLFGTMCASYAPVEIDLEAVLAGD